MSDREPPEPVAAGWPAERLRDLGRRARTLDERLACGLRSGGGEADAEAGETALALWRKACCRGERDAFRHRLAWDGLDEAAAARALGAAERRAPPEPPAWTRELAALLESCRGELGGEVASDELPFAELFRPFVAEARRRLEREAPELGRLLSAPAIASLEHGLLAQLSALGSRALIARFDVMRKAEGGSEAGSNRLYRRFVGEARDRGLDGLLSELPVLGRLLVASVETWVDASAELVARLAADRGRLARAFADSRELGPVLSLDVGLSDRHDRGRQVAILGFADGMQVVYKPRDLTLEAAYNAFLSSLAAAGLEPAPAALRVVAGTGYGWVEHVAQCEAGSLDEVRAAFRRAGALLAIAYLLNGRDLHMDNLVAGPQGPVLVDAEAILQPELAEPSPTPEHGLDAGRPTCLESGLLAFLLPGAGDRLVEIGGLCGRGGHLAAGEAWVWRDLGSDAMRAEAEPLRGSEMANVVRLEGRVHGPEEHAAELVEGFVAAHRFLAEHADEMGEALRAFAGARVRVVFRPSNLYALLLERLTDPEYLADGLHRSLLVDSLNQVFRGASQRPLLWPLVADERAALERLDIPRFTLASDRPLLEAKDGTPVEGYFARSGLEVARRRLAALDEDDLGFQLERIEGSLLTAEVASARSAPLPSAPLVRLAGRLAGELARRARASADGSVGWASPPYQPGDELDADLAGGLAGPALFLAAHARVSGETSSRELALAACRRAARLVLEGAERGLGALDGLGGVVYALAGVSRLLGERAPRQLALAVADLIGHDSISSDARLDVEGGAAGAILGLLALAGGWDEGSVLERALACAERLLAARERPVDGVSAWPRADGPALAGFAHGAAGIAYALARLGAVTGRRELTAAAREGFAFERELFSEEEGNWLLLERPPGGGAVRPISMRAWCHGAPGVALARAAARGLERDPALEAELEVALATTVATGFGGLDHLCCGNLGRIEVVLTCGRLLDRSDLVTTAGNGAAMVIRRTMSEGGFRLRVDERENRAFHPGFFHGLSGVGYELLRLAEPDLLPSVLALHPVGEGG